MKDNQTGSGREKGIPLRSFEFKIGKLDTLGHYFYKSVYVSVSPVPLLLQGNTLYYLSQKTGHFCLYHANKLYKTFIRDFFLICFTPRGINYCF